MKELSAFMQLYFYQVECILTQNISLLKSVKFQSEEANTDEGLKAVLKKFLLENNTLQPDFLLDLKIVDDDGNPESFAKESLNRYIVEQVFLPVELTKEHERIVKDQKQGVYTKPDLLLLIKCDKEEHYLSVELKSTKSNKILGSSVRQVSPHGWVIFIQHKNDTFKVATGQYINCITNGLSFPDRSPRPEVGFNTLVNWNSENRVVDNEALVVNVDKESESQKLQILSGWNEYLVAKWMQMVKSSKGKWFSHTIRLFALELLQHYDTLSQEERESLLESLREATESYTSTEV